MFCRNLNTLFLCFNFFPIGCILLELVGKLMETTTKHTPILISLVKDPDLTYTMQELLSGDSGLNMLHKIVYMITRKEKYDEK